VTAVDGFYVMLLQMQALLRLLKLQDSSFQPAATPAAE
jgi:hypothetical protein